MSRADWQALVREHAEGRPICNCGDAYAEIENGHEVCPYGCSSNLVSAKNDIARRVARHEAALAARVERLEKALREIAAPRYGLQGLVEEAATDIAIENYWHDTAGSYVRIARRALATAEEVDRG